MGMIVANRNQLGKANDPEYVAILQEDFQTLKKRKRELGTKLDKLLYIATHLICL